MLYIRTNHLLQKTQLDLSDDKLISEHDFYSIINKVLYVQVHTHERRKTTTNNWLTVYEYFNIQRPEIEIETMLSVYKMIPELMNKPICSHC